MYKRSVIMTCSLLHNFICIDIHFWYPLKLKVPITKFKQHKYFKYLPKLMKIPFVNYSLNKHLTMHSM